MIIIIQVEKFEQAWYTKHKAAKGGTAYKWKK